LYVVGN